MFFTSIESVLTIVILIAVGYFLQKYKWFGPDFSKGISKLVVNVGLPCSIFTGILANLTVGSLGNLGIGLIFPFGTVIVSYIIAFILMKVFKIRPERRGIFLNGVANANTIFVGMPLNIALFGEASIPYYLVCYISNTISTWVIGIIIMSATDPHKEPGKKSFNWKKVLTPPLVGFIIGLIFLILSIPVPDFIISALKYLGAFVTPLALIYIGIMLYNAGLKNMRLDRDSILALVGRFVICPIIIIILILLIGNRMYLGLSLELLAKSFESSVIPYAFIIKLLLTSITLATGFQGGEVTPLFVIGATLGNFLANIVGLPISFLAGIGMIGVFCGGT